MRLPKTLSLVSTMLLLACFCVAQTTAPAVDPEKEKAKKELDEKIVQMLDQVVSEASYLRLPQNKAIVFAMTGDLFWKYDEKRARDLFRSAGGEILAYNLESEREKRDSSDGSLYEFMDFSDIRNQVLPLVAKNDAELALDMLVQTRPAALAEAMLRASAPDAKPDTGSFGFSPENQRIRQEIALEQQFALLAADENPDRAIKLIKDSLAKGVSYNVLQLLQKLHKKDEKKALELAGEVIKKLVDTDLGRKMDEMQVAMNFLQMMARATPAPTSTEAEAKTKAFQFSDAQAKDLANKLVNTFMQPSSSVQMSMSLARALPNLEKIVPEKAALLKQRQAESQRNMPNEFRSSMTMQRLWDQNSTPESILAEIPKMGEMERMTAYQALTNKISQVEDETRAKRLIDQIGDEKARARAQEQYDSAKISRVAGAGKLEDARKMIGALTNKRIQIQKFVGLAQTFYKKGTEADQESALALMKNARSLVVEPPEDEDDMNNLMEVVRGYGLIDPDTAFKMFEPIVDQINEIVHANGILSKYNKRNRSFKKGELLLRAGNNSSDGVLLFRYLRQIQILGKADLTRMSSVADRFQRSDVRTLVKIVAVQGALQDDKKPDLPFPGSDFVFVGL